MSTPPAQRFPQHASAATPEAAGFAPSRLQRLTAALRADSDEGVIPGAVVLILRDGKLAYHEAFGYADRKTLRPMQRECIFRIASMTKPVTVTAALMLMEQGKLLLTEPVWRYIPELRDVQVGIEHVDAASGERRLTLEPARRAMTIHDLMRHTAGFTYGHFGDSLVQRAYRSAHVIDGRHTNADMAAKLAGLPLAHQPGSTFEYGMSTDVLGRVVEIVSGMGLDRFFVEHITGPLAMPDTAFGVEPDRLQRLAEPQRDGSPAAAPDVPYDPAHPAAWFSGGGGLLSTTHDYARFCQMLLNEGELDGVRLLARRTVQWMTHDHLPSPLSYGRQTAELGIAAPLPQLGQGYGLGLGVRVSAGLSPVPGSVGDYYWGGALGPYFWVDPQEKLIVVFMLQELNVQRRTRYRSLLRGLVYHALR
jgi:CubicO group peptidase (beta-lactamase class C family)